METIDKVSYLGKKSVEAYREGGLTHFLRKSSRYILHQIQPKLLFSPIIPPVEFGVNGRTVLIAGRDKGYMTDNAKPKKPDTVIEVGAYHGRDTAMFAKLADKVIAFEPSPRNYSIAKENLNRFSNVQLINKGVWKERDELKIKYGESSGDDGFLEPDSGDTETKETEIPVNTLEEYVKELDIESVDYLKVEAEGAEPEIIEGLGDLRPQNIVVNIDKERNEETPGREIVDMLTEKGYTPYEVKRAAMMFFTLDEDAYKAFSETLR